MNILFKEMKKKKTNLFLQSSQSWKVGKGLRNEDVPGKTFSELPFPALFYIASGKRSHRA